MKEIICSCVVVVICLVIFPFFIPEGKFTVDHYKYTGKFYPKYRYFYVSDIYGDPVLSVSAYTECDSEEAAIHLINKYAERRLGKNIVTRKVECVESSTVNGKNTMYILEEENVPKQEK